MKRTLSIITAASILAAVLLSCSPAADSADPTTASHETTDITTTVQQETTPEFEPDKNADYGGYKFRMLGYDGAATGTWQGAAISEVYSDGEISEPINDAIYRRNREVEELYNIEISIIPVTYPNRLDFAKIASTAILAGDDLFDAALTIGLSLPTLLGTKNMAVDLRTIKSLDLTKSWWDQNSIKSMSIDNKVKAVVGDINLYSAFAAVNIYANKKLIQDYSVENPYQLVRDGKWTWDKLYEIGKSVTIDLDGNSVIDQNDQIGLFTQNVFLQTAITSAGEILTPKNSADLPEFAPNSEKVSSIIDKIIPIFKDKNCSMVSDDIAAQYNNVYFDFTMPKFRDGQIMFLMNQLLLSFELRSMDADFAILPIPKISESQEKYGTIITDQWCTFTLVPVTCTDVERTGTILQAMGYYSQQYVMPAYYDVTISNKVMRDEESAEMLKIILDNRCYDLSLYYNWGGLSAMFQKMVSNGSNSWASDLDKNETVIKKDIQKTLDALNG